MAYTTIDKSTDYFNTKLYNQNATGYGLNHEVVLIQQECMNGMILLEEQVK
jgi:hypothetical protein